MAQIQHSTSAEYTKLKGPGKYNVIMLNDDTTPMEFVVNVLMDIFNKSEQEAHEVMMKVHENGRAIAGTYSFEVAEQKSTETVTAARASGFPLDVSIEEQ